MTNNISPTTWVSVNKTALKYNYNSISDYLSKVTPKPKIIAVVKANAYGHDAVQSSKLLVECGASFLGTTTASEALTLRNHDINSPVIVFAPPLEQNAVELINKSISITVCDIESLKNINVIAKTMNKKAKIHLKIDTGMGRLGCLPADALSIARYIDDCEYIEFEGIYTHFGRALEKNPLYTEHQFEVFQSVLDNIKTAGINYGIRHCANSAGILLNSKYWLDAVRPGTILYGQYPSKHLPQNIELKDTWQLKTHIITIRNVNAGTQIGYGAEYTTKRQSRIAVIPIGYTDGFTVSPSSMTSGYRGLKNIFMSMFKRSQLNVTLNGHKAPVLGRVAMQLTTIDITENENASVGDVVIVPSRRLNTNSLIPRIFED